MIHLHISTINIHKRKTYCYWSFIVGISIGDMDWINMDWIINC